MVKHQRQGFWKSLGFHSFCFGKDKSFNISEKTTISRWFHLPRATAAFRWHRLPTAHWPCPADTCWWLGAAVGKGSLLLVLGISKGPKRIPSHASISSKYIEIPIISKEQLSSIMVGSGFFYFQDHPKEKQGGGITCCTSPKQRQRTSHQCCPRHMEMATEQVWCKFLHIHVTEFYLGIADFLTLNNSNTFSRLQKCQIV